MYVWFDALVNYVSTLGWPEDRGGDYAKFWEEGDTVQYAGKDNLRQQSAMWQAMLMAAGLPNTKQIVINGFINGKGGVKMSKSIGNVIAPDEVVSVFGTDAFRYFVLRELSSFEDGEFTMEGFKDAYNAGLANGIGNLASRVMTLSAKYCHAREHTPVLPDDFVAHMENFKLQAAANMIWEKVGEADKLIQETEPFKVVKTDEAAGKKIIDGLVDRLAEIALMLESFLPDTALRIQALIRENTPPVEPLFPRMP